MIKIERFNEEIINNMRQMAKNNKSLSDILQYLIDSLHLNKYSRFTAIINFRAAFPIGLSYAKEIGAWDFFDGGTWSIDMLENRLQPKIDEIIDKI